MEPLLIDDSADEEDGTASPLLVGSLCSDKPDFAGLTVRANRISLVTSLMLDSRSWNLHIIPGISLVQSPSRMNGVRHPTHIWSYRRIRFPFT